MKRLLSTLALGLLGVMGTALAAPQLSPQGIIVNPVPTDLQVRTWVDKDPNKNTNPSYQVGEPIRVSVQVNQDAYVYLFSVKSSGQIGLILPNAFDTNNLLKAGETRTFPPASGAKYALNVDLPEGQDRVLAVASRQPLSLDQIANIQSGQVNVQGADNLARALSIVVTPLPQQDWVSNVAFFVVGRVAAPAPTTGTLSINSNPQGAQVLIGGRAVGNTPLNVNLQPGRYTVDLRLNGYQGYSTPVDVRAGQTASVNANLSAIVQNGLLQINSNPQGAQVLLNGQAAGNTPLNLTVRPGQYQLEFRLGGYQTASSTVSVGNGQTVPVNVNLAPIRGSLDIFTNVDARIFINGQEVGQTRNGQLRLENLNADTVQIVAIAPGYRVVFQDVRIQGGRNQQVRLEMMRVR